MLPVRLANLRARNSRHVSLMLAVVVSAATMLNGCVTTGPDGEPQQFNLLSTPQEIEIGKQLSAEVEKEQKVHPDPYLQSYVRRVGERLASKAYRTDVPYQFTVIDNPGVVNAFALPGGHMYVYTGLLLLCQTENELAGVMGHEIGHVAGHHHGESLTRQYGAQILTEMLLGPEATASRQQIAAIAAGMIQLRFSRSQELEADRQGMRMLVESGYNPEGLVAFMRRMLQYEASQGAARPMAFLSSHPATERRVADLELELQKYPPDVRVDMNLFAPNYAAEIHSRARVTTLPANQQ